MTETLETPEAPAADLAGALQRWEETPPPSLGEALTEQGIAVEALEEYARSGIGTDDAERLRRVLVQGATSGKPEDAALLARLTPLLDPRERAWDRVMKAKASGEILTATVTEAVKGGVVVDLGVRGFVPSSQLGLSVPRNLTQYIGRPLKLRVKEVDRRRQTVILSNREIAEEERAEKRRHAIARLEEGQERTGIVRRLTDIGAFVDVGGIDGLLHVSEISWKRIDKPSDVLNVGDKVQVKVLRVDPQQGRVSLSSRRLTPDPWEEVRRKYVDGSVHTVKVARTVAQGAVIELEGGMEGFLPISELAARRVATVEEVVQPGQDVEALVIDIVPRDRRIVFSLRKLEQRRERAVVDNYQKKARTQQSSSRTTLGDLFGHLFEEYQPEEETPAPAVEAAPATEAPAAEAVTAAVEEVTPAAQAAVVGAEEEPAAEPDAVAAEAQATVAEAAAEADVIGAEESASEEVTSEEEPAVSEVAEEDAPAAAESATEEDADAAGSHSEAEPKPEDEKPAE
jgi:predicted RNA-binding protein with RPS1 domain